MDYQKIKSDHYNIHLINNNKFHNINFSINFIENVTEQKFADHNVLVNLLTTACKKYDTRSKIIKRTQDLYSISPGAMSFRVGNYLVTKFWISILDSKYLDKDIAKDNILLLKEIVLNPLCDGKKFNQKYFDLALHDELIKTEKMVEHSIPYVNYQSLKLSSSKKENYLINKYSDINLLQKLTNEKLYQSYQEMLKNSKIDFFIAGNIRDREDLVKFIEKEFTFSNIPKLNNIFIDHFDYERKMRKKTEKKNTEQSKLSVLIKAYDISLLERRFTSSIFNTIFGGGSNSLLNMVVRENNSMAYSIYSFVNKPDNTVTIDCGFNKNNYNKLISIIEKALDDMKTGKFNNSLLASAKKNFINDLLDYDESNRSLVSFYFGLELFGGLDVKERISIVKKITKKDIMNYANKLKIASIYFLEGDV